MQRRTFTIRVAGRVATVAGRRFEGQWSEFYVLLGCARDLLNDQDRWVTANDVAKLPGWRDKPVLSIRKQVRDHCERINKVAGRTIVESPKRKLTHAWRTASKIKFEWVPDRRTAVEAIAAALNPPIDEVSWRATIRAIVLAALAINDRNASEAQAQLAAARAFASHQDAELFALMTIMEARAASQRADADSIQTALTKWNRLKRGGTRIDSLVQGQLAAFLWLAGRFDDPAAAFEAACRRIRAFEDRVDAGTLAIMENVAAILGRRAKRFSAALAHQRRSVVLSALAGDFRNLEGSLSNYALCCRMMDRSIGTGAQPYLLDLVATCRDICCRLRVGNDSVQTERHGAEWAHDLKQHELEATLLADASERSASWATPAHYERASLLLTKAELSAAHGRDDATSTANEAMAEFELAGDPRGRAKAATLAERLEAKQRARRGRSSPLDHDRSIRPRS